MGMKFYHRVESSATAASFFFPCRIRLDGKKIEHKHSILSPTLQELGVCK